jgi:hypothetical protein
LRFFSIPTELGFNYDSFGINVHSGYAEKQAVISEVERVIKFFGLAPYHFKFIELYDGVEVYPNNIRALLNNLLP